MLRAGRWGGVVEIICARDLFQKNIYVHQFRRKSVETNGVCNSNSKSNKFVKNNNTNLDYQCLQFEY